MESRTVQETGMGQSSEPISQQEFRGIADRVELTELLSRYHQTIDLMQWDRLDRVFVSDAKCAYLGLGIFGAEDAHLEGRDNIIEWLRAGLERFSNTNPKHFFSNHVFEIEGDIARTRSYMQGTTPGVVGVYEIQHVRTEQGWRIRDLRLMHFLSEPRQLDG
jgi:hypothetical protein